MTLEVETRVPISVVARERRLGTIIRNAGVVITDLGTGLPATVYSDEDLSVPVASPKTDGTGTFTFYAAPGTYRFSFTGGDAFEAIDDVKVVGSVADARGVTKFNGRGPGDITFLRSDIVAAGAKPDDVGAIPATGGAPEAIWNEPSVSGSYTFDLSHGNHFVLNLSGDVQLTMPTVDAGKLYGFTVHIYFNGHNVTAYDSAVKAWRSKVVPTFDTSGDEWIGFVCEGVPGSWEGMHFTQQMAVGSNYVDYTAMAEPANPPAGVQREWYDILDLKKYVKGHDGVKYIVGNTPASTSGVITMVGGQVTSGSKGSSSLNYSRSLPAGATAGNRILAVFTSDSLGNVTPPTGWSVVKEFKGTHNVGVVGIYLSPVTVGGEQAIAFSTTLNGYHSIWAAEFAGMAASPVDSPTLNQAELGSNNTTLTIPAAAATAVANSLVISAFITNGAFALGQIGWGTSGFTTQADFGGSGVGSKSLTATATPSATPTWPGGHLASGVIAAFKAA